MKMSRAKVTIIEYLLWCGILLVVHLVWAGIEMLLYGAPQGSLEDSIMGGILAYSLYRNLRVVVKIDGR